MKQGYFITFEGGEGTGKSTQVKLLADLLSKSGHLVYTTREPGGTEVSEQIRKILKTNSGIDPITEALLMFAARREHFIKSIQPRLQQGYIVICDRFCDSSLVYQGILKSIPIEHLIQLKTMTLGDFEPNLTIILDLPSNIAKERISRRQLCLDDYDLMSVTEYNIIRNGFKKICDTFPDRCKIVNSSAKESTISYKIVKIVKSFLRNNSKSST